MTQEQHVANLPLGTRGGTAIPYTFPLDATYEIQLRLYRDRNEHVEGLGRQGRGEDSGAYKHELELTLDEWDAIRQRPGAYPIAPGHPIAEGEQIVERNDRFEVAAV